MNWKFWERERPAERAAPLTQEEEHDMGLYLRREETPEGAFMAQLQAREAEENRYGQPDPAEGEDDQEPAEPPDLIATAPPEIQQAVEARLAQERQQMRASLGQIGIDLTADGRPAFRDMNRLQAAAGWQGQAQQQQPAQQQQQPPPRPQPLIPVPELDDPEDGEIPDPQYAPREYRQWLDRRNQYHLAQALNEALAPVMGAVTQLSRGTTQMYINQAVGQVEDAVQQHMPWISGVLDHPSFEAAFRQALSQIEPDKWQTPQDLAAVAGMVAPYLPPLADAQFYQPQQQQPAPQRVSKKGRYQQQYDQPQYQDPGYLSEAPAAGPARGQGERNERGQFVGRRAAAAAVSQAAAQQAAPSRGGGRPTVAEQYDQVVLEAAVRGGISPEEVKALMQDSTGDAAEVFRKKRRLEALK